MFDLGGGAVSQDIDVEVVRWLVELGVPKFEFTP